MSKLKPRDFEARPPVPCAHEDCPDPAVLSRKLQYGWSNLCKRHDLIHVQDEAEEFCRQQELTTTAKKRERCRRTLALPKPTPAEHWHKVQQTHGLLPIVYEMAAAFFKRHRAPGQDDEERATA